VRKEGVVTDKRVRDLLADANDAADSLEDYIDRFEASLEPVSIAVGHHGETVVVGITGSEGRFIINCMDAGDAAEIGCALLDASGEILNNQG
jgi:hypothetical protein